MRRKLILLNLALAAAVGGLGWQLRSNWREAEARRQQVSRQSVKPAPAAVAPVMPPVTGVNAAQYIDVAQKMLFARDRNPNVVLDVAPPKPMPALPFSNGFVDFGGDPTVLLSEKAGAAHKAYRPGDTIGAFRIVSVNRQDIVFEWDGKEVKRTLAEIATRNAQAAQPAEQQQAAAPAEPATAGVTKISGDNLLGPGKEMQAGSGYFSCQPGDTSPAGTVVNGARKVMNPTPFGGFCRWEPVGK
ncbi:MAG: hypothetical protein NTY38_22390 [Acidobacteria bacterium]|nr:hypothetical protein [Acidobacteriota bacterium]